MDLNEYFMDFIDGELDDVHEQIYFDELARNQDSRQDFKDTLSIVMDVRKDMVNTKTSPAVTTAVMAAFAEAFPLEENMSINARIKYKFKNNKKFLSGFASGICACIIAAMVLYLLLPSHPAVNESSAISYKHAMSPSHQEVKPEIFYPELSAKNKINKFKSAFASKKFEGASKNEHELTSLNEIYIFSHSIDEIKNIKNKTNYIFRKHNKQEIFNPVANTYGLSFEVSNSAVWNLPSSKIPIGRLSPINNLCASIYYSLNDNLKVGVEGREESFYMEFNGTEQDSLLYNYFETASFFTLGAKVNYQLPYEILYLKPVIQAGAGINKGGFAFRPYLGLKYQPYENLSMNLGTEYTWFWFTHQNKWFNTSKLGLIYGVSYSF